jgi:chromosome segregation ATPase
MDLALAGEIVGVAVIAAAAVTALYAARVSRRLNSGNVTTSAAADLWQAAEGIRKDLRDEAVRLSDRLGEVEKNERECRAREATLNRRIDELTEQLQELRGAHG